MMSVCLSEVARIEGVLKVVPLWHLHHCVYILIYLYAFFSARGSLRIYFVQVRPIMTSLLLIQRYKKHVINVSIVHHNLCTYKTRDYNIFI